MKKAQISAFIVLGLLIVASTVLVLYLRSNVFNQDLIPEPDEVGVQFEDVQSFVMECVSLVSEEAIIKMGEHGGYIEPMDPYITDRSFNLNPLPYNSDVVFMNPGYPIPYWWYLQTPNDCQDCLVSDNNVPNILEMEAQINRYVSANLETCLAEFADFSHLGFEISPKDDPVTRTIIGQEKIDVYVRYPLDVVLDEQKTILQHFPIELDLNFINLYSLALAISEGEKNYQYLETILLHLISAYSDVDPAKLPPFTAFEDGFKSVLWTKNGVEQKLRNILRSHVSLIQVINTGSYEPIDSGDGMYNVFSLYSNQSYPDIEANFIYLGWPIYLDITPRKGELLKPTTYRREFPFGIAPTAQTNTYEFFYDVSYPVVVELRDVKAFGGKGYSFLFALEATIMDNKNLGLWHIGRGTFGPWDYSLVTYSFNSESRPDIPNVGDMEVPEEDIVKIQNRTFSQPVEKLFCDEAQRISGNVTIIVKDAITLSPVRDAGLSFGCGTYSVCSIDSTDAYGIFKNSLPICIGEGYIKAEKEGYSVYVDTGITIKPGATKEIEILLEPMKTFTADILLIPASDFPQKVNLTFADIMKGLASGLQDNHQVILSVTKVKNHMLEPHVNQVFMYDGPGKQQIELSRGTYTMQATFMDTDGVFIPAHSEVIGGQDIQMPDIDMTPAPLGGATITTENGAWLIDRNQMQKSEVNFYIFAAEAPTTIDELQRISSYEQMSDNYRTIIEPEFS